MSKRRVKEKFQEDRQQFLIEPKNKNQELALAALFDDKVKVIILDGFAGVGKSYITGSVAAHQFRNTVIEKIIVTRPYVQTGKSSGLKPGTILEKLYPYVRTILDPIEESMGTGAFLNHLKDGQRGEIRVQELESVRGMSFDTDCFLIVDEAQQTTPEEMESIITRVGEGCKLVLCGDIRQKDIKGISGLEWFIDFYQRHGIEDIAHIKFTIDDCVRSGFVKQVLTGIEKDKAI